VVYSSPCPIHLHYFDNTTAPLLILQDNNDPRRRPSPCGEGSVRYMRAFTKAAIAAVRSSSSSSSSSSGTSISSKSSSNRSITRNYSSSSAGNAEREQQQQRSTRSRGAAPSYKSNHATRQPLPLAVAFCRACRWESRIMTYVKLRAPQATRHPVPTHQAHARSKKQEEARSKKKKAAGSSGRCG
jgi:hypothetical protein